MNGMVILSASRISAHVGRLLLSPRDPFRLPDRTQLAVTLTEAGFLGAQLSGRDGAFAVGDSFLQLVIFTGCSVRVELSPNGKAPFCHIRLTDPFEQPRFLWGRNTRPPRCPNCRHTLQDWKRRLSASVEADLAAIPCPSCGEAIPPWAYDWKDKGGLGRLFIRIEEVFPGEAVPTPRLMDLLHRSTGSKWRYFYLQDGRSS
jgi:hypothetical protein